MSGLTAMMAAVSLAAQYCGDEMNWDDFARWCRARGTEFPQEEEFREFMLSAGRSFGIMRDQQVLEDWAITTAALLDDISSRKEL
jgi:hypothetical protein